MDNHEEYTETVRIATMMRDTALNDAFGDLYPTALIVLLAEVGMVCVADGDMTREEYLEVVTEYLEHVMDSMEVRKVSVN